MKPRVYIETTIVSNLTARLQSKTPYSPQAITRAWWRRRNAYDLYTSQFVIEEASLGSADAAARRLAVLDTLPLLDPTDNTESLAVEFETALKLPPKARYDALHLAISVTNGMDFLLTWNCKHLANGMLIDKIDSVCETHGLRAPHLLTPTQLQELP